MKIGIYGGSFNPPHLGHMAAAAAAMAALSPEKLFLVPAGTPPHKALAADAPSGEHRLNMTRLAADALLTPEIEAADVELRRAGPSYTADTLAALRAAYPEAELWLVTGWDMFLTLQNWYDAARFLPGLCVLAFARTEEDPAEALHRQSAYLSKTYGTRSRILTLPQQVDISSTRLRALLAKGEGEAYLAPSVYGYILREGLYGTVADLGRLTDEQLRAVAFSYLRARRIPHVLGTEEEALRLAARWGEDPVRARRAAILHDCTKYFQMDEQLILCEKYGIVLDNLERESTKLLHAPTAAALARDVFGADDAVCEAIRWHTTGRADMSGLEKILYLADYIEPTRDFEGVEALRALAYQDLDAALEMGFALTVDEMARLGSPVHERTLRALAFLKGQRGE